MGKIFIWPGEGRNNYGVVSPEIFVRMRDLIARELRFSGFTVVEVAAELDLSAAIAWINARAMLGDVALALETNTFPNSSVRGTSVFYIANNTERRTQAEQLLRSLVQQVPSLVDRGVQPDTVTELGSLAFIRQIAVPSLVVSLGYTTNMMDWSLISERSSELAFGVQRGLALWSRTLSDRGTSRPFAPIDISVNGELYGERGILVEGNAYIPVNIVDQFNIDSNCMETVRSLNYGGVAYIRSVDLRNSGVFVDWDYASHMVLLRTTLPFKLEDLGNIIGSSYLPRSDYEAFLNKINPAALQQFPEIAQLYQEEAAIEGVNADVAFAQALLEANFFGFSGLLQPTQNNFAGLGSAGGSSESASFPNARIGVRAHIQHLKAYASKEPLVQEVVDPRFKFIPRGVAPKVEQLSRRWSAEAQYGENILAMLRRMYESAGLL